MYSIKKLLSSLGSFASRIVVTNKYVFTLIVFLVWISFFDKSSLITQFQLHQTIERLEDERVYYLEKIEEAKLDRIDIEVNKEKYARERYYMHRPDEEVFIIER